MTIYRGEHGLSNTEIGHGHTASKDVQHGLSWTYEPSVAGFFAVRTQSDDCQIYTAKVHKDDVLLIYDERKRKLLSNLCALVLNCLVYRKRRLTVIFLS